MCYLFKRSLAFYTTVQSLLRFEYFTLIASLGLYNTYGGEFPVILLMGFNVLFIHDLFLHNDVARKRTKH